jgi:hypothetical protein
MAGAVFFVVIVAVGAVLAAVTGTVFLLFPFVAIALGVVIVPLVVGAMRNTSIGNPSPPPHGTTSTSEASYEPVQSPKRH